MVKFRFLKGEFFEQRLLFCRDSAPALSERGICVGNAYMRSAAVYKAESLKGEQLSS